MELTELPSWLLTFAQVGAVLGAAIAAGFAYVSRRPMKVGADGIPAPVPNLREIGEQLAQMLEEQRRLYRLLESQILLSGKPDQYMRGLEAIRDTIEAFSRRQAEELGRMQRSLDEWNRSR